MAALGGTTGFTGATTLADATALAGAGLPAAAFAGAAFGGACLGAAFTAAALAEPAALFFFNAIVGI
jgi:hypothetical protein